MVPVSAVQARRALKARVARGIVLGAVVAGCGEPNGPGGALSVSVAGRLERGSTVAVQAMLGGRPMRGDGVTWSAQPSDAVLFLSSGRARLVRATHVELTATTSGATGSLGLAIAVPPTIVFDLLRDGNRDVYRAALDGGDLLRLTTHPADDEQPTVAGNTVVFVSYRDGRGALYAVPPARGSDHRLAVAAGAQSGSALSPDGRLLAYVETDSVPKLWVADAAGSNAARGAGGFGFGGSVEASPAWAPSSDRLVFVSTAEGDAALFQLVTGAGTITALVQDSTPNVEPAWSPDGRQIAFASEQNGATHLYLLDLASGAVTR